jgi:putative phage-type endonuclease
MHPRAKELIEQTYADQRSQEWLNLRGNLLTASDAATAIGLNPYEKPEGLLAKKCGAARPWAGNEATAHGTRLEPMVRDLYDMRHGQISHEIGLVQHPVHKFLGGSPDGITESGRLLEIKCPLSRKIKPEVPGYYLPQIQLLLEIMDLEMCDFVQYKTGPPEEFVVVEVPRDREWFAKYLPVMKDFWDRVIAMRKKGICDVEIDEISVEAVPVEEPACEVELELN